MNTINKKTLLIALSALVIGVLIGWLLFGGAPNAENDTQTPASEVVIETTWTCSMHPQIRQNEPGDCPICGMELIPLESEEGEIDPMSISMSPTAMQLANVQTWVVSTGTSSKTIRLNGKVQEDERLRYTQSSHIPGRIEKLMVNFTGEYVKEGQTIALIYSPELVTAQEELLEASKIKASQPALLNAAKEKLKNWKLTEKQIEQILSSGKPVEQFPVLANVSGYVTQKKVNLGDYIKQGQAIYEVADLSKVWVLFEVYESDMPWIHKGDKVNYTLQSLPGETFTAKISYVDPTIDPKTRVAKARVEVNNRSAKLKPGMFASGKVETNISNKDNSLSIPKTAVMWTGKRSVVYIKHTSAQRISFSMREVTLGPELGDAFVIESGLQPGEEIAVNGTFSIDAAAQLAGKPSMMNPEGGTAMTGHSHGNKPPTSIDIAPIVSKKTAIGEEAKKALTPLLQSYFEMKSALAKDDLAEARKAGKELNTALSSINMSLFKGTAHDTWMSQSSALHLSLQHIEHMKNIDELRMNFMSVSQAVIAMAESFTPLSDTLYVQHCPMANSNNGADWLSLQKEIQNPYFGKSMLTCGKITKTLK